MDKSQNSNIQSPPQKASPGLSSLSFGTMSLPPHLHSYKTTHSLTTGDYSISPTISGDAISTPLRVLISLPELLSLCSAW